MDDVPAQPWRNGGGSTRELLVWPSAGDWTVRVSVAEIDRCGPFSAYPGVDRWFAVLSGAGVLLNDQPRRVQDDVLQFAGEAAPDCRLIDGPTQDFNLMHRRGRGRMSVVSAGAMLRARARWLGLFTADGGVLVGPSGSHTLGPCTLAWLEAPESMDCRFTAAGSARGNWWLMLEED